MVTGVDLTDLNTALAQQQDRAQPDTTQQKKSHTSSGLKKVWVPPGMPENFRLDSAMEKAYSKAKTYMNKVLQRDGLYVEMQQHNKEIKGVVKEMDTGKTIREYNGIQVLKLYAYNLQARGMLVDGRV